MDGRMIGLMGSGWMDTRMDRWMDEWVNEGVEGCLDRLVDG
jgi:hypothetical protein